MEAERDHSGDVFVLDDMRLYGRESWDNGNFDGDLVGDMADLTGVLKSTHRCEVFPQDEGYMVALPR